MSAADGAPVLLAEGVEKVYRTGPLEVHALRSVDLRIVRAVRERRRQIGMLRAMGLPSRTIRRAFVLEAGFIAARGLLIGGGLAVLSSWLLATRSDAFGESSIPFSAPWGAIAAMLAAALVASLAATAVPAARAAAIRPAVALRVAD